MKNYPGVSLCISTYNWPQALKLCLESILFQSHKPDEIIIGDDGSSKETKDAIWDFKKKCSISIIHIWQPDEGFKLAQIRNKSFAASSQEYIIQIDGDVILNRYFIEDHLKFAKNKVFIAGTRSLLTEISTKKILKDEGHVEATGKYKLIKKYNALRSTTLAYINFQLQTGINQTKYVIGANMSFWQKDLVKVNGYNEEYNGWGKEDNDLAIRLHHCGVAIHCLRFSGIVYHLMHKEMSKEHHAKNTLLLSQAILKKQTFTLKGLNKYLNK